MAITKTSDHIKIEGHRGKWYVIDEGTYVNDGDDNLVVDMFLLEHETYGDEAACLIVDEEGEIMLDDVWNGLNDLEDAGWTRCED